MNFFCCCGKQNKDGAKQTEKAAAASSLEQGNKNENTAKKKRKLTLRKKTKESSLKVPRKPSNASTGSAKPRRHKSIVDKANMKSLTDDAKGSDGPRGSPDIGSLGNEEIDSHLFLLAASVIRPNVTAIEITYNPDDSTMSFSDDDMHTNQRFGFSSVDVCSLAKIALHHPSVRNKAQLYVHRKRLKRRQGSSPSDEASHPQMFRVYYDDKTCQVLNRDNFVLRILTAAAEEGFPHLKKVLKQGGSGDEDSSAPIVQKVKSVRSVSFKETPEVMHFTRSKENAEKILRKVKKR